MDCRARGARVIAKLRDLVDDLPASTAHHHTEPGGLYCHPLEGVLLASGCREGITDWRSCAKPRDANLSRDLLSNTPLRASFIPFHYRASPGRPSDLRHRGGRCPPRWRARCPSGRLPRLPLADM